MVLRRRALRPGIAARDDGGSERDVGGKRERRSARFTPQSGHRKLASIRPCSAGPQVGWAISVAHDEAAVDVDRLARHVVAVATREKAYDAGHVLGSLRPAEGDH